MVGPAEDGLRPRSSQDERVLEGSSHLMVISINVSWVA